MGTRQSCSKACSNCAADCTRSGNAEDFDENERPGGDPAGATFGETLEDLNSLDRNLMLFCAAENLAAVRWLTLQLGAHWDAFDANGTTCLHVACRAGSLPVVAEMMQYKELVQAVDNAGWTPLHIAVLMGRQQVVIRLLQAEASLRVRNSKGQLPVELCADSGTHEAIRSFELHIREAPGRPEEFNIDCGHFEDTIGSRLQYEPFFVPRQPMIRSQQYKKEFQRIGIVIFNKQPGFGLAFLVASGVARDYPVDMSTFLRRSKVDIKQVGAFLGEAFSLSHTIRLELVNSVVLQNTGVVSALIQVFHMLQLPDDLQKINRLVHGVARIWWRQHERLIKDLAGNVVPPVKKRTAPGPGESASKPPQLHLAEELCGLELKQYLTSADTLHQLMFSAVLLHWFIYKDGTVPRKEMSYAVWMKLNEGIETGGGDVPEHVQLQIYSLIGESFIPELAVATTGGLKATSGGLEEGGAFGPSENLPNTAALEKSRTPILSTYAAAEGWAQIVGGGFPRAVDLTGNNTGTKTVTYSQVSSIFSEVTHNSSGLPRSPLAAVGEGSTLGKRPPGEKLAGGDAGRGQRDDFAWLSLCYTLLFFAASHSSAPYAFVELQKICIACLDEENHILSLVGAPEPDADTDLAAVTSGGLERSEKTSPIIIVLLLPDGRWQELGLQRLELRVPTSEDLKTWSAHLAAAGKGKVTRPPLVAKTTFSRHSPGAASPPVEPLRKDFEANDVQVAAY
mmetsp:Transcript_25285/g.57355  ORF Transcript_25285/g.57355 Transcript_25285/m.57355 type:complete len:736 (+) Transcript_25285:52-2259(+)